MWQRDYDADLQQYYFTNTDDNTISYDLPCEVQYTPEIKREKSSSSSYFPSLKKKKSATSSSSSTSSSSGCPFTESTKSTSSASSMSTSSSVLSKITSVLSRKSSICSQKSKSSSQKRKTALSRSSSRTLSGEASEYVEDNSKTHSFNVAAYDDSNSVISGLDDEFLLEDSVNYGYQSKPIQRNYINGYNSDNSMSEESIHSYYSELARDSYYYEYDEESVYDFEKEKERLELRIQMQQELEA